MLYVALVKGSGADTKGVGPGMYWVPLVVGVMIWFEPGTGGIAGFAIRDAVLSVN